MVEFEAALVCVFEVTRMTEYVFVCLWSSLRLS